MLTERMLRKVWTLGANLAGASNAVTINVLALASAAQGSLSTTAACWLRRTTPTTPAARSRSDPHVGKPGDGA
jgi:hypothetical protein